MPTSIQAEDTGDAELEQKLAKIESCASTLYDEIGRSLLHAYIACLEPRELNHAVLRYLGADQSLIGPLRGALVRLGRYGKAAAELDELGLSLLARKEEDRRAQTRIDPLLSALYPYLGPPTRKAILDRWMSKGNRSSAGRWLKAMNEDDLLFDIEAIRDEWRRRRDPRAAKIFVWRADPAQLQAEMPELIDHLEEGWIISKAALRVAVLSEDNWAAIREKFPATYAYLCEKLGRAIAEDEAYELIERAGHGPFGQSGLAIWAIGQLKLDKVLDRVLENRGAFFNLLVASHLGSEASEVTEGSNRSTEQSQ